MTNKQVSGYLCILEREGSIHRPNGTRPKEIYVTEEGKKKFYDTIIKILPENVQDKIKENLNSDLQKKNNS